MQQKVYKRSTFAPPSEDSSSKTSSQILTEQTIEQDDSLNWRGFVKSKSQIQDCERELLPLYLQYRKILVDSLKEISGEYGVSYNSAKVSLPDQLAKLPSKYSQQRLKSKVGANESKKDLISKLLGERKIKRQYQKNNEIVAQIDDEDHKAQLQAYYQSVFKSQKQNIQEQVLVSHNYQAQFGPHIQINNPNLRYSPPAHQSQQQQMYESSEPAQNYQRLQIQHHPVHFQNSISFDAHSQHQFARHKPTVLSGVLEQQNFDVQSAISGNAYERRRAKEGKPRLDNDFESFIENQTRAIERQRRQIEELEEQARKLINEEEYSQQNRQASSEQEDKLNNSRHKFSYILKELINIFALQRLTRSRLAFKTYEMLLKLYQKASQYYQQSISLEEPIKRSHFWQIIRAVLPEVEQTEISLITQIIFVNSQQLTFNQFVSTLQTDITEKQCIGMLQGVNIESASTYDTAIRLFNIWIELQYFSDQFKRILRQNHEILNDFVNKCSEYQHLLPNLIAEYIHSGKGSKNKQQFKATMQKADLFLQNMLNHKGDVSSFYDWVKQPTIKMKTSQLEESYYNL